MFLVLCVAYCSTVMRTWGNPRRKAAAAAHSVPLIRFPSFEFKDKFQKFATRSIFIERQIDLVELQGSEVVGWINRQNWDNFAMLECSVNLTMVREFYCNISSVDLASETIKSYVCGREITITLYLGRLSISLP